MDLGTGHKSEEGEGRCTRQAPRRRRRLHTCTAEMSPASPKSTSTLRTWISYSMTTENSAFEFPRKRTSTSSPAGLPLPRFCFKTVPFSNSVPFTIEETRRRPSPGAECPISDCEGGHPKETRLQGQRPAARAFSSQRKGSLLVSV